MKTPESATAQGGRTADVDQRHAQTVRDDAALTSIADEWEDLYRRCPAATGRPGRPRPRLLRRDETVARVRTCLPFCM